MTEIKGFESDAEWYFQKFLEELLPQSTLCTQHLIGTPKRVVRAFEEIFDYHRGDDFKETTFANTTGLDQMIVIDNLPVYSLCAHHFLPFLGRAHIAYIPTEKLLGLSKFARIVRRFASWPQVQEELTQQIADHIEELLRPRGVAVVLQCEHMCMSMRGANVPGHLTTTSVLKGAFLETDNPARLEFLELARRRQ